MTAIQNNRESRGRHPLLKQGSLSHRAFMHLKVHPELSIREIAKVLLEDYQSVNGCLQRMKAAGLVYTVPKQRGNRKIIAYRANIENETGHARDVIEVEIVAYVNEFGEYSVKAAVVGQFSTATEDNPRPINSHVFMMVVPKPKETRLREIFSDDYKPGSRKDGPIIEHEPLDHEIDIS